jgi:exodeoxyribonuclease-3
MRILSWNIRHGGGQRLDRIASALERHSPDIIVLIEFRAGPGLVLRERLGRGGWVHQHASVNEGKANGLLLASRVPFAASDAIAGPDPTRFLAVLLPEAGFGLWAAHVPGWTDGAVPGEAKTRYWDGLLGIAAAQTEPTLLIGDLNTGRHEIDEARRTFNLSDRFERLSEKWIDVWRHIHGDKREFTWFSRSANGFRLDHAFVTASMSARIGKVEYSHAEREEGISDHSPLVVGILEARR